MNQTNQDALDYLIARAENAVIAKMLSLVPTPEFQNDLFALLKAHGYKFKSPNL